jgi:hypothetical protein
VLLEEESNFVKAGALSFKTKAPGIFGDDKLANNGHPFSDIDDYSK